MLTQLELEALRWAAALRFAALASRRLALRRRLVLSQPGKWGRAAKTATCLVSLRVQNDGHLLRAAPRNLASFFE